MAELAERDHLIGAQTSTAKIATAHKGEWICNEAANPRGDGRLLADHIAGHLTEKEVVSTHEGADSIQSLLF